MLLAFISSLLISSFAYASSEDHKYINYSGKAFTEKVVLNSTKKHTEYEYYEEARQCQRNVFQGYETECVWVKDKKVCRNKKVYKTETYDCTVTMKNPIEVLDFDVVAEIKIHFGAVPENVYAAEIFKITLNGDDLDMTVKTSRNHLIHFTKSQQEESNAKKKKIKAEYFIKFYDLHALKEVVDNRIQNLSLAKERIEFYISEPKYLDFYKFEVKLEEITFMRAPEILFDKVFPAKELFVATTDGISHFLMELKHYGVVLSPAKYRMKVNVFYNLPLDNLLNLYDLKLQTSYKKIKKRIR
ncbi:MAG: hypothetical protein JNM93_02440 [Bacteriovoracaceae bacterium]|nr:hypothetical protein [Bacteriovoracaceae bacterium]